MSYILKIGGKDVLVDRDVYEKYKNSTFFMNSNGYAMLYVGEVNGKSRSKRLHRLIIGAPPNMYVDHINRDRLDNRRCNLRLATKQQNNMNRKPRGLTSKYKGVSLATGSTKKGRNIKWKAQLIKDGRRLLHKFFDSEEEAARAYDAAAKEHFGEFAYLNFK